MTNVVLAPVHTRLLNTWTVLQSSGVGVSHTGNATETVLATVSIAAGAMGPNGALRVSSLWNGTNSANNKNARYRLGGLAGTAFLVATVTTTPVIEVMRIIHNRNSAASQISWMANTTLSFAAQATATTASINTAVAQDFVLTGQLVTTSETITLEAYMVELFYGA